MTEAECTAGVACAQDMLYIMQVIESVGLDVEKMMVFKMNNKGAVDLANNWSVGGHERHIDLQSHFLWELNKVCVIKVGWISTDENVANLFTKSLPGPMFEKHTAVFCRWKDCNKGSGNA